MVRRRTYDIAGHAHFVTFSCCKRRPLLLSEVPPRSIVTGILTEELAKLEGGCAGFVVMPDHVHALVWFAQSNSISRFMKQWKQRSSIAIKKFIRKYLPGYAASINLSEPVWQRRYYGLNVFSEAKAREKLDYMHANPVRAGLAGEPCQWQASSASFYERGICVGVPITWPF